MNALRFAREVRAEMAKVTWPDLKTTRGMTLMVFVLATLVAIYLLLVDWGLSSVVNWIIDLGA